MKRPYLTQQQRQLISIGTLQGDLFMLNLACKKLCRDVDKEIRLKFCYHKSDGFFWVRIFGVGFAIKDINKHPLIFSEREGNTIVYCLFYPYYLKFLPKIKL